MENELPEGWIKTTIGTVGEIVTGNTPSKSFPEFYEGNIPWVKPSDVNKYTEVFESEEYLSELGAEKARIIPKGSVMVTCIGNLGNVAIAGVRLSTNQQINSVVISHNFINNKFGYYWALRLKPWLVENSTATTISMVNKSNFEKAPFPLPPLAEQKRIVAKLDTAFAHLETLKASLTRIPELLKKFRQTVLTQAITGKLTASWREENESILSALELIDQIRVGKKEWYYFECEKNEKKPRQPKFDIPYSKDDLLNVDLPLTWSITFLEEITANKENALKAGPFGSSLKKESYVKDGYKVYGQEQVIKGDIDYGNYYISSQKFKELESCKIEEMDILISLVGTIGKILIVPSEFKPGIINPRLLKFSLHELINKKYIKAYLDSSVAKKILDKGSHGGTMEILNLDMLKKLPIPLPPLQEQQEIVNRLEALFATADATEAQYLSLKAKIDALPQALLAKAFQGELVPQDPADEPASVLLAKIKASQATGGKKRAGQTTLPFMGE